MIKHIPKYVKFLKDLCVHKKKLKGNKLVSMGKNMSVLIQSLHQKCEDPRVFTILYIIGSCVFEDVMLDLGASINVMPRSVFQSLGIGPLQPTGVVIQLANCNHAHPARVIKDVLVKVRGLIFPADFYFLDMEGELSTLRAPLILGKPFLKTARTKIDVHAGILSKEIRDTVVQFNILDAMKYPMEDHSLLSIGLSDDLDYMDTLIEFASHLNISDISELCLNSDDSDDFDDDNRSTIALGSICDPFYFGEEYESIGTCVLEATPQESLASVIQPLKFELKSLPVHLKYVYLEKDEQLPGISPFICMHRIHLEEDVKPVRQLGTSGIPIEAHKPLTMRLLIGSIQMYWMY